MEVAAAPFQLAVMTGLLLAAGPRGGLAHFHDDGAAATGTVDGSEAGVDLSRPAISVWSYSTSPQALNFLRAGASPGNGSWVDFFMGGAICGGDDGVPGGSCDPPIDTARATKTLGVPGLFTVRHLFFADRHGYPSFPTLEQAESNWTAFKPKLPATGVLGFFLGDELGVANGTETDPIAERIRWAADRIRADFPTAIVYVNALCATVTGNSPCSAAQKTAGYWSSWIGKSNISWISQDFYTGGDDATPDQADYERYLFPFLRPDQKVVLVPQVWVPRAQCGNSSQVAAHKMAGNNLHHLAWAMEDPRVAAVIPFALGCAPTIPDVTCAFTATGEPMLMDQPVVSSYYRAFSSGFAPRCKGCIVHKDGWGQRSPAEVGSLKSDDGAATVGRSSGTGAPDPPDMAQLECAIHQLAFEYGTSIVKSSPRALHDALNLANCSFELGEATVRANERRVAAPPAHLPPPLAASQAQSTFFVAPDGSDDATGTVASPFETLHHAAAAARAAPKPAVINLRQGKYYLNSTLELRGPDSHVVWTAYQGEHVVLSGGVQLHPKWKQYKAGIWQADIPAQLVLSDDEQRYWSARRSHNRDNGVPAKDINVAPADLPPAPAGWQRFPAHCMSEKPCTAAFCVCASRPYILDWAAGGFKEAQSACAKDHRCTSFALLNYEHPAATRFETYAGLRNDSAVANTAWNAYAMVCDGDNCKPPPAPPSPPPPSPPHPPAPPAGPHEWGAPPAHSNTLFVNGIRQVRARYPNANPQDGSGICFSAVNRPGEGCAGYLGAKGGGGTLPAGVQSATVQLGPNRGESPTYGCPQCAKNCPQSVPLLNLRVSERPPSVQKADARPWVVQQLAFLVLGQSVFASFQHAVRLRPQSLQ